MPPSCATRRPFRALPLEPPGDARHRFLDGARAGRIGEAQIALAEGTEAGPRDRGDPGLVEEPRLERAAVETGPGDVGEGIEGASRHGAAETRKRVQRADDDRAPLGEGGDHPAGRVLWAI